jgi:hypothetical protein
MLIHHKNLSSRAIKICHPERSEGPASVFAVAFAFLSVIPEGHLLFAK